jgi:hypothetical protein
LPFDNNRRCGYEFAYSPGPPAGDGRINTFAVHATPPKGMKGNYYYVDQSGVIRQRAGGPAGATDVPLGE